MRREEAENNKRISEERFALQLEEKKLEIAEKKRVKPKLPDLQISKFKGTNLDWLRFWSFFQHKSIKHPSQTKLNFLFERTGHTKDAYNN